MNDKDEPLSSEWIVALIQRLDDLDRRLFRLESIVAGNLRHLDTGEETRELWKDVMRRKYGMPENE